jgi:cytidylate kinase
MVTVSATYGAGGTLIAPALATRLGLGFADRLTPWPGPMPGDGEPGGQDEAARDDEPTSSVVVGLELLSNSWNIPTPVDADELPERVRAHIATGVRGLLDGTQGVVILGRAGCFVLADEPRAFHVRLDGPVEARARRGAAWEGISLGAARGRLRQTDESRARFTRRLYRRDASDASLYHVVLDTTALPIDACVTLLTDMVTAFWRREDALLDESIAATRARLERLASPAGASDRTDRGG